MLSESVWKIKTAKHAIGSYMWTRQIRKDKGLTAYVAYKPTESNRVYWAKVR